MSGSKNKKRIALRYSEHLSKMKDKDKKILKKKRHKKKNPSSTSSNKKIHIPYNIK
ncbi:MULTISPECIES: hypothetical protein [Streptococcus]|uniref:hypothetical protein n=1 Tax=Streptococcus TaxID=1301 RepID=UPI0007950EA4|nr:MULTISPECIES: hypothetical protein [Streptococcus]KXT63876.1 hypothetical protein STRDD04_01449 [Streptococcus sp. DD04]